MIVCTEMTGYTKDPAAICNPTEHAVMFYEIDDMSMMEKLRTFLKTMKHRMLDNNYTDIIERQNYSMGAVLDIIDAEFPMRSIACSNYTDTCVNISFEF